MRKNRAIFVILFLFILISMLLMSVYADDTDKIIKEQMDALDIDEIQSFADQVSKEAEGAMPALDVKEMVLGLFKGNPIVNVESLILGLGKMLIKEVVLNFNVMG
ncbi:MAG TPA: hypothetical protein VEF53_02880, partial [Patescibacteria group bacterium]|nr:hypothetical protein [Patescibacteria group bacterium]